MKTDNYLALCLEQAEKSPLYYRHGCVIVRGGKVIGQGYNDYRPGFNGGALKTGRIAVGSFSGPAIQDSKDKHKRKHKQKPRENHSSSHATSTANFTPFESVGGGHYSNVPLSMHSEMMAVHSALSASSTLSSAAFSRQKPRSSSTSSVSAAPPPAPPCPTFKSAALNRVHVNQVRRYEEVKTGYEYEYKEDPAAQKNRRMAFQAGKSAEKHQKCGMKSWNRSWEKGGNQNRNHHGRPGEQKQQWQASVCKGADSDNNFSTGESGQGKRAAADCGLQSARDGRDPAREARHVRHESNTNTQEQRFVCKKKAPDKIEPAQPQPTLLPAGRTGHEPRSVKDRMKHPRLNGADLYVARLGWRKDAANTKRGKESKSGRAASTCGAVSLPPSEDGLSSQAPENADTSALSTASATLGGPVERSLHDELRNPHPRPRTIPQPAAANAERFDCGAVHASRPCYRCVAYMHSVGIRRVFWTNEEGEWEGGKVRDLVDALEGSGASAVGDEDGEGLGGPTGNGVFVTKHEVLNLMLRRLMGDQKK